MWIGAGWVLGGVLAMNLDVQASRLNITLWKR